MTIYFNTKNNHYNIQVGSDAIWNSFKWHHFIAEDVVLIDEYQWFYYSSTAGLDVSCLHLISYTLSIRHHTKVIQITYHHDGINKSLNFACFSSVLLMNLMFQYRLHNAEHTGLNAYVYLYAERTNWMFGQFQTYLNC